MPDAAIVAPTARRCPSVDSRPDERGDLSKQPRRSQQPDVHVFFLVATSEIGTCACVRLVKPARTVGEGRRHDEHSAVTNHPGPNCYDVFLLRPHNGMRLTRGGQSRLVRIRLTRRGRRRVQPLLGVSAPLSGGPSGGRGPSAVRTRIAETLPSRNSTINVQSLAPNSLGIETTHRAGVSTWSRRS